ncbi:hypothetical protein V3C99_000858 [Haemonchus contortus]
MCEEPERAEQITKDIEELVRKIKEYELTIEELTTTRNQLETKSTGRSRIGWTVPLESPFCGRHRFLSSSVAEAETILAELNKAEKKVGPRISQTKTQSQRMLGLTKVKLRSMVDLSRNSRPTCIPRAFHEYEQRHDGRTGKTAESSVGSFAPLEVTNRLADPELRASLFDSTVLLARCYGTETWVNSASTSRALSTSHRALERCLLRFYRLTQYRAELRSSDMSRMSRLCDPVVSTKNAKYRWTGRIMRRDDDR